MIYIYKYIISNTIIMSQCSYKQSTLKCVTVIWFTVAAPVTNVKDLTLPLDYTQHIKSDILKDKQLTCIINILLKCFLLSESILWTDLVVFIACRNRCFCCTDQFPGARMRRRRDWRVPGRIKITECQKRDCFLKDVKKKKNK